MNKEISRIKKYMNLDDVVNKRPERISYDDLNSLVYNLNQNMNEIYQTARNNIKNSEYIIEKVCAGICDLMEAFASMGISIDYFWRVNMKANVALKKVMDGKSDDGLTESEIEMAENNVGNIFDQIRRGINIRDKSKPIDINDNFVELVSFFEVFKLPFNNSSLLTNEKYIDSFIFKCCNSHTKFLNGDDIIDDVYNMMEILFKYMTFLVEVGVNPKEYVDKILDEREREHTKTK